MRNRCVFFDVKNDLYCVCQYVVLFLCQNQNINIMAQSTLSMRVDETLKKKFDMICDDFGFTSTAAITVFMKAVVRERKIPFEIKASSKRQINQDAWNAFIEMRAQAKEAGAQDMSLDEINAEIQRISETFVKEFEENLQYERGYQDVIVKSEVISTTQDYFTLKLICYQGAGSGSEWNYYYTIDLDTGERLQLKDLFKEGADYITLISENIKTQMREQMAADDRKYYWIDDEMEELNFKQITDETAFYINEQGNIVMSFNEGDVAPMYMGVVTFEIPEEVVSGIRK